MMSQERVTERRRSLLNVRRQVSSLEAACGAVCVKKSLDHTTPSARQMRLRGFFLMSHPPLLS